MNRVHWKNKGRHVKFVVYVWGIEKIIKSTVSVLAYNLLWTLNSGGILKISFYDAIKLSL